MPFSTITDMTFLSSLHQRIFFPLLITLLPDYIRLAGVQYTQVIADVLTILVCVPSVIVFFVKLKKNEFYQPKDDVGINLTEV